MSNVIGARAQCYCHKCSTWRPETDFSEIGRAQHKAGDENAMCQRCVDFLWKKRLGRDEIQGFVKEDRERLLQRTRDARLEKMVGAGRVGQVMHHSELIRRVSKLVPNIVPAPGNIEGDISLYRVYGDQVEFVCYTNSGHLPEFSIVRFNKDRQPIHEVRGWRTVLLRLIKFGLLTEEQVNKEFGHPSSPQEARFWAEELYQFRNKRITTKD